jgi:hypothetical protein
VLGAVISGNNVITPGEVALQVRLGVVFCVTLLEFAFRLAPTLIQMINLGAHDCRRYLSRGTAGSFQSISLVSNIIDIILYLGTKRKSETNDFIESSRC